MSHAVSAPGAHGATRARKRRIPVEMYDRVATMLIGMVPYQMITRQLSMEWKRSRSYVMGLIRAVHEDWAADAALLADTRRHQVRAGFEKLLLQCFANNNKDMGNAVRIMRELGLLDGCYAPTNVVASVHHQGQVGVGISLGSLGFKSPEDVRARIDEIRAKLAEQGPSAVQGGQVRQVIEARLAGEAPDNSDSPVDS